MAAATRLEIRPFTLDVIDEAARLLATRHRLQRLAEPGLSSTFEEPAAARLEIETIAANRAFA